MRQSRPTRPRHAIGVIRAGLAIALMAGGGAWAVRFAVPVTMAHVTMAQAAAPAGPAAAERQAVLDDLFRRLKVAADEAAADAIVADIWRSWLASGRRDVDEMMGEAQSAMRLGQSERARKLLDQVIVIAPDHSEGWNLRATFLYFSGDHAGSVADIQKTLALEPRHFGALAGLGLIHIAAENWGSAVKAFERALEINPFLKERWLLPELRKKATGTPL